jgi:hypothetical protein
MVVMVAVVVDDGGGKVEEDAQSSMSYCMPLTHPSPVTRAAARLVEPIQQDCYSI